MISSEDALRRLKNWKEKALFLCGQFKTSPGQEIDLPLVSVVAIEREALVLNSRESQSSFPETITLDDFENASFSDGKGEKDPQFAKAFSTPALVIFLKDKSCLTLIEPPADFASILGDDELFEA